MKNVKAKKRMPFRSVLMSYRLNSLPSALKEWRKLSPEIKSQFKERLRRRLETLHVNSARIRGYKNYFKIK